MKNETLKILAAMLRELDQDKTVEERTFTMEQNAEKIDQIYNPKIIKNDRIN